IGDAGADRYAAALAVLLSSPDSDALLVLNVPTALASARETASRVAETVAAYRARVFGARPGFAVGVGEDDATGGAFRRAPLPPRARRGARVVAPVSMSRGAEGLERPPAEPARTFHARRRRRARGGRARARGKAPVARSPRNRAGVCRLRHPDHPGRPCAGCR